MSAVRADRIAYVTSGEASNLALAVAGLARLLDGCTRTTQRSEFDPFRVSAVLQIGLVAPRKRTLPKRFELSRGVSACPAILNRRTPIKPGPYLFQLGGESQKILLCADASCEHDADRKTLGIPVKGDTHRWLAGLVLHRRKR